MNTMRFDQMRLQLAPSTKGLVVTMGGMVSINFRNCDPLEHGFGCVYKGLYEGFENGWPFENADGLPDWIEVLRISPTVTVRILV